MSISLNANFELLSAGLYLDDRQQFNTLIEMKDFAETSIPDGFITYNKETQKHYVFNSSNTVDAILGKWREYNSGGGSSEKQIKDWVSGSSYLEGDYIYHWGELYRCLASNSDVDFDESNWEQITYGIDELSKEDVERLLGLTKEEIEAMADLILDTEVRIDKTYSSSKIYTDIQQCLEDSKTYTLEELEKVKIDDTLTTTDKTITGAINEVNGDLLDTVGFSADYKNIILNRKNGLNPYTIPISAIINNASLAELKDVDSTDVGDGKTLVYDGATNKHKYVDSSITDEFVKMDSTTDAKYLSDLIDKSTVVNDNGVLKVKKLDGQEVTITEINYLKGLTMNVMDLVSAFSNGGVKVWETPVNTYSDLETLDRSTFIDGISYIVYVLIDETHSNAKTTYLCTKTSTTFFGNADSQRNFTTNPIDLANEVTGKLGTSNIDVDNLWTLLTINDTYKTLTTNNEIFGTHGAKAMYDELLTEIGAIANATDLTTHTNDTDIHVTTTDKSKWDKVIDKVDTTDFNSLKTKVGEKANTSDIPTKVSELTNDSNYVTRETVNAELGNKVDKTDIVDNLTSTNTDKPLSAKQGKVLKDEVDLKANDDEVVKKTDITNTIDINSSGTKIPNVKAIYNDIIIGKDINQTVIDTYGTEILKYPLGIWRFGTVSTASKFADLPVKTGGRIEITSIKADTNSNPWNSSWAYRVYNFETFTGMNYFRKVTSTATPGIGSDTGWQKVCTTIVADVPKTSLTPVFPREVVVGSTGVNINYIVRNGWCNINFEFSISSATTFSWTDIATGLPKPENSLDILLMNEGGKINRPIPIKIYSNGTVSSMIPAEITTLDWWNGNISYPVAE